jgi:hypothetical protein
MIYTLAAAIVLLAVSLPFAILELESKASARAAHRYDRAYTTAQRSKWHRHWQ